MNRRVFDVPITKEDVEALIKRALDDKAKMVNYHMRTFSEEKVGFLGAHRHLVVTVQRDTASPDHEIHTFFLKSVPYDIEKQASMIEELKAFYKETNFYRYLMPELMSSVKDKSWTARCYLVKDDAMLFEDLKSRNFTVKDKLLDPASLKSALASLAKLHAASILTEKRLGKSLLELYPEVLQECLFLPRGKFYDEWFCTGVDVSAAVAQYLGLDSDCVRKICHGIFDKLKTSQTRRNVVCHGDAWSYNLMFDDSQPSPNCIMVDFQIVRYAPPTTDVVQVLYLTTKREFREQNEENLLRYYHRVFCETLRDNDAEIELPSCHDILEEYEERRIVGLVTAAQYFPVSLVEGKMCAELTKDSDGFSKLLFEDRVDLVLDIMQKDPIYRDRIAENIREMVQKSKQLLL